MSNIADKELISSFKMKVSKSINEGGIRGLSAAIVRQAGPIWLESFGFTDASKRQKVDVNTLFGLQSTTKTVTSVVFLLAVQAGLVGIDDPIVKYYPEFRMRSFYGDEEYKKITFRHLLSHMGSLPREAVVGGCFSRKIPDSFEEHIESINDRWLQNLVGTTFQYSNIGMDLVPYLLERITNKPYPKLVQELLGNKLGIKYYWTNKELAEQKNVTSGYYSDFEAHKMDDVAFGCGGAFISLKDHATFVQFLLNKGKFDGKTILETKYFEELRTPYDEFTYYGFGTSINLMFGTKLFQHAGGGFGLGSEMYWIPESDIGLIILYNNENAYYSEYSPSKVIRDCLEEYLAIIGIDASANQFNYANKDIVDIPIDKLKRLVGQYNSFLIRFNVVEYERKLFYQVGSYKVELKPHTELAFTTKSPFGIIFELDEKGAPKGCKLYHSSEGLLYCKFQKKGERKSIKPAKENWKENVGIYYCKYYYTEYMLTALTMDSEGYLVFEGSRLIPHETEPNIFVNEKGIVMQLLDDSFFYDNTLYTKMDNVVEFFTNIVDNEPNHRAGLPWVFDSVINNLKQLGNENEANKIIELKKKHLERKN